MIKVDTIYAVNDKELQEKLNEIVGRIIKVENTRDDWWQIIYEEI